MHDIPTQLRQQLAAMDLTVAQAARKIGGDDGYKAAHKRLTKCTNNPPTSLTLLEADLNALGLLIKIEKTN